MASTAAFCPGLSGNGLEGRMRLPLSGSRRRSRMATETKPADASDLMLAGVVFSSRQSCVIQPPPRRLTFSTSHFWRVVREVPSPGARHPSPPAPAGSAASTKSCSFARALRFSTAAGTAARRTDSIGDAV